MLPENEKSRNLVHQITVYEFDLCDSDKLPYSLFVIRIRHKYSIFNTDIIPNSPELARNTKMKYYIVSYDVIQV